MAFTTIQGSGANDATSFVGSAGVDTILLQNQDNFVLGAQAANDNVTFQSFTQLVSNATIRGGRGNDTVGFANNTNLTASLVNGNIGADPITLNNATSTTVYGGQGLDVLTIAGLYGAIANGNKDSDSVTVTLASGSSIFGGQGADTLGLTTVSSSVAQGDNDNDTINLNGAVTGSTINGNAGADSINVLAGTTTFSGSTVFGGAGNDTITAANAGTGITISTDLGNDSVTGSANADSIFLVAGADSVDSGFGTDTVTAGTGVDTISLANIVNTGNNTVNADLINQFTAGAGGDLTAGFSITNLELQAAVTDVVSGNAATVGAGAVATAAIDTTVGNALVGAGAANVIIQTGNYGSAAALQTAIRAGASTGSLFQPGDAFIVIYDNGTNSTIAQVSTVAGSAANAAIADAVVTDLAVLANVADATQLLNANFSAFVA